MLKIIAVEGDLTEQQVDAVVNAANTAMRGGGGVDGAIHRAGGPAILRDCVSRFPDGLATGDAGWTTAGDLPAQWVIHTVGPNYNAGQRDRSLLESCYRRSLEVADQLGARTVAFPLISTGIFGWPRQDAIAAAIESIADAKTGVDEVRLVTFDPEIHEEVLAKLASWTPLRILQGVQFLHRRGYHRLRILPGLSPSGMHWRIAIANAESLLNGTSGFDPNSTLQYTTGKFTEFAGGEVTVTSTPESVAELILNALPEVVPSEDDPAYVSWFAELVRVCERSMSVPVAYADYFDSGEGWEVGSGVRYPPPPEVPIAALCKPASRQQLHDTSHGRAGSTGPAVRAANSLTARWCGRLGPEDFVVSGAGLWPLLALLASAADEQAAAELAAALGCPAESAVKDAMVLLDLLDSGLSTTAALGLWTRKNIELHQEWTAQVPDGAVGTLTDQAALDRWATQQTAGLIDKFPLAITPDTLLVLASALTARVRWQTPFEGHPRNEADEWSQDPGPPERQQLSRTTHDLAVAAVLDDMVTRVVVEGDGDVDVHLLLGHRQSPADVLAAGLRELADETAIRPASDLSHGPGFNVSKIRSGQSDDIVRLTVPSFEIKARHNLIENADLFGLSALTDPVTSHLPLLSPIPLYVSHGAQSVLARFFAEGFEAAAVTAFGLAATGAPDWRYEVKLLEVSFDQPFGFLAVHRPSRLAVAAGWVSSPFQPAKKEDLSDEDKPPIHSTRLSIGEIEALKAQGYNQTQIAKMFGVSRQAVSWHKRTYGGRLSIRQVVNAFWPWTTTGAQSKAAPYQRLRDHGEFIVTGGRSMSNDKLKRLNSWWRRLRDENLVVEFDPNIPPIPGVSPSGGFAYRERMPKDLELLIRINEHTDLTESGRRIWCWPPDSPLPVLEEPDGGPHGSPAAGQDSACIYLTTPQKKEFLESLDPFDAAEAEQYIIIRD